MKIFFSHASREKPLVREILSHLPKKIDSWIDEDDLPLGANITSTIKNTIKTKTDLVILFISNDAIKSKWVKNELDWAINREKEIGYRFIFPIVIDIDAWNQLPESFKERKYYKLSSFESKDIENLSLKLKDELFNWLLDKGNIVMNDDLKLSVHPFNIISGEKIPVADNKDFVSVTFKNKNDGEKNKINTGLPGLRVNVVNTSAIDVEIQSLELNYNNISDVFYKTEFEKDITGIDLSSLVYGSTRISEMMKNDKIIIPARQKRTFELRGEPFMRLVLTKGIKEIILIDVSGNKYLAPLDEIDDTETYLKSFFDAETLHNLYKEFNSIYNVEF